MPDLSCRLTFHLRTSTLHRRFGRYQELTNESVRIHKSIIENYNIHMRFGSRRWQTLALVAMALVGVGFGIWLLRRGFALLGCLFVGVFLWRAQQFAVWFIAPAKAPADITPLLTSRWRRLLLSIVCLLGAAVCAIGVYLWQWWPKEWQAGLVFVLFGLIVLAPVTVTEIRSR